MSAALRILYVAYPLLAVTEATCGGAEQVLLAVEREMQCCGHPTIVAAAAGSRVAGELYPTGAPASASDQLANRDAEHNRRILQLLAEDENFDLVHDMSGTFWRCAHEIGVPVLATVHLPPGLYSPEMFDGVATNVCFNCVSESQAKMFEHLPRMLGVVQNGINLEQFPLLRNARALLITSMIDETSSLVAMEAAACGTPVIAFRRGAIPEIVADGRTGLLVDSLDEMLHAIARLNEIDHATCRGQVERNFSAARMANDYERMYQRVLPHRTQFTPDYEQREIQNQRGKYAQESVYDCVLRVTVQDHDGC
jgi:hypothetical protein